MDLSTEDRRRIYLLSFLEDIEAIQYGEIRRGKGTGSTLRQRMDCAGVNAALDMSGAGLGVRRVSTTLRVGSIPGNAK
ncbi:uncharacterized protein BO96DRAFT_408850 [Aspergillus niger CBS 101883]|uniref:uncharacterized protein n=1 Tax=Aspergillus lacticoffeatus (strain CBS 101883) TaxID=1450533 RepID=UPI000D7FF008|nr:uncharacterized protein BO96DRAFT_408850 [Aspergillus niger CBS 101883]PYH60705.1 hypothetical protein BO96DRAFT_408850 [Aspergillus niger CBS 101883]